jgi:transcriptional regulator with XRE-family HTH domain
VTQGLTQARLAQLAGVSQSLVTKAEAGEVGISLDLRAKLAAACGHELSVRLFPVRAVRLRDAGQLAIATVIAATAHQGFRVRMEVPTGPGPYQAADLILEGPEEVLHIEIERSLVDFQAQLRAASLKRDALAKTYGVPVRLVIAVPHTATSRLRLDPHRALIARSLPIASREVWAAIREGRPLGADGILMVRMPKDNQTTRSEVSRVAGSA